MPGPSAAQLQPPYDNDMWHLDLATTTALPHDTVTDHTTCFSSRALTAPSTLYSSPLPAPIVHPFQSLLCLVPPPPVCPNAPIWNVVHGASSLYCSKRSLCPRSMDLMMTPPLGYSCILLGVPGYCAIVTDSSVLMNYWKEPYK